MPNVRVGIIGVGNCASGIVQAIQLYRDGSPEATSLGHPMVGRYSIGEIEFASAFDVGASKVGRPLSQAIYSPPNDVCWTNRVEWDPVVRASPALDGVGTFVATKVVPIKEARTLSRIRGDILDELKRTRTEILVNYLPVGSQRATEFWADVALDAGCGFVNCIPVFIASDKKWSKMFASRRLPIVGDDVKGAMGATIVHRALAHLCSERGAEVAKTYQINVGGNTDFLNMKELGRLESKRVSKTEAVQDSMTERLPQERIYVGPSDYIPFLGNTKLAFIRLEGRLFPGAPFTLDLRLEVDDKANSAGVVVDAIRYCKIALDREEGGPLEEVSAWLMKHPPVPMPDGRAGAAAGRWAARPTGRRTRYSNTF